MITLVTFLFKPDEPSYFADKIVVNIPADILEPPPDKVENNIFTNKLLNNIYKLYDLKNEKINLFTYENYEDLILQINSLSEEKFNFIVNNSIEWAKNKSSINISKHFLETIIKNKLK